MNRDREVFLHLSLIDGVGPATIATIRAHKAENLLWADMPLLQESDWRALGLSPLVSSTIVTGLADTKLLEQELRLLARSSSIDLVMSIDDEYPTLLAHIDQPPVVLYVQGRALASYAKSLAIVGSRNADNYAKRTIDMIVPSLVARNWSIVSGGARGADTMAHQVTLAAQGATVAVLGSGLLCPYPTSNTKLFESIVAHGGTMVSIFPLMAQALPHNFPARNRVIAGLSRGCLVVQAAQKSGASITAHYALEQGREVFAIPGPVDHSLSIGCNELIQAGAKLVMSAQDILQEFGEGALEGKRVSVLEGGLSSDISVPPSRVEPAVLTIPFDDTDTSLQGKIVRLCQRPASTDDIADALQLPIAQVQQLVFELQLEGVIVQDLAGQWTQQ